MYRIAIVEDEKIYQNQLTDYLKQYQKEHDTALEVTVYQDGDNIVEDYQSQFDIIFMDIQMRFMDGMSAAREIRNRDPEVVIIFITNMDQFATKGYEVDALDYVLKPITYFVFAEKLDRAIIRLNHRKASYMLIDVKGGVKKLDISHICYIESQGHNVIYHTLTGTQMGPGALKDYEEKLADQDFIRCNKGLLVNLRYVDGIVDGYAQVHGENLSIGRTRKNIFMEALTNYLSKVVK